MRLLIDNENEHHHSLAAAADVDFTNMSGSIWSGRKFAEKSRAVCQPREFSIVK
jgi:hypothetical protein